MWSCGFPTLIAERENEQESAHRESEAQLGSHVHCVTPAGGLSPDHTRSVHFGYRFFLPLKVLSRVFRDKFVSGLQRTFLDGQLHFPGYQTPFTQPKTRQRLSLRAEGLLGLQAS